MKGLVEIDQMIELVDKNTKVMSEIKNEIEKSKSLTDQSEMLSCYKHIKSLHSSLEIQFDKEDIAIQISIWLLHYDIM